MAVIRPEEKDFAKIAKLFKDFFRTHNIFSQPEEKVVEYIKEQAEQHELIADPEFRGAMFIVMKGESADKKHKIWKFRHFAFTDEITGKELLEEAEKIISGKSETAKIELTIAETEEGKDFYIKNGYKEEGALLNHYRWGETCFILGKSIQNR